MTTAPAPARAVAKLASLEMRAIAFVLDLVILFICASLFFAIAGFVLLASTDFGDSDPTDAAFNAFVVIWGSSVVVWTLLEIVPTALRGQTIGKAIMGLKVVRRNGRAPGLWRSAVRFLGYLVAPLLLMLAFFTGMLGDTIPRMVVLGIDLVILVGGFGMVFFTRGRRALQDYAASTYVIEAGRYLTER